ncbi:unnamed protein product [Cuscuta campestris]|uniref:WIYLD domain-containing protein n=1 Tax=Cuscuta campestris TaxID=132261 RepID=A0A484N3P4_9ASTE|nr:unnamed protein product [Cuscuta campestris]
MGPDSRNRIVNAFRATKALGISEEKVKPVLKRLLKIYNKNWDLIEEENYRSLLDAIFEYEEAEAAKRGKSSLSVVHEGNLEEEEVLNEEPERPLKRSRLRQQDGQPPTPSNVGTSQTRHDGVGGDELLGLPQSSNGQIDSRNKGKQPVSTTPQPSNGHRVLMKPIENVQKETPVSGTNAVGAGASGSNIVTKSAGDEAYGSSLEIASLTGADGKVVLNIHTAFGIPNFQMPSLGAVMKAMDEKCRERYKDADAQFSVMKVMEDVCRCFLEPRRADESSVASEAGGE